MSEQQSHANPEKQPAIPDNDRKFIAHGFDLSLFDQEKITSFKLTTDWLETNPDDEKKIAHKAFTNGTTETLLIKKVKLVDGDRKKRSEPIDTEEYAALLKLSIVHVEKTRHEFTIEQHGMTFKVKYDEFVGPNDLRILEIDAASEDIRDAFDPAAFPAELREVSDDRSYEGYRVVEHL